MQNSQHSSPDARAVAAPLGAGMFLAMSVGFLLAIGMACLISLLG